MVLEEISDLHFLHSIFYASPRYFQANLGEKEGLIRTLTTIELVENEVDLLDLMTAIEAAWINKGGTNRRPRIGQLLKKFQWNRQSRQRLILSLCFDESLVLSHLYRIVKSLTLNFCDWAISIHHRSGRLIERTKLSLAGNHHIQRAMYCLESTVKYVANQHKPMIQEIERRLLLEEQ